MSPYSLLTRPLDRALWLMIALLFIANAVMMARLDIGIDHGPVIFFINWGLACILIAYLGKTLLKDPVLFAFGIGMLQMHLALGPLAWLSYLTTSLNRPLYDESFIALDHMLGFDWLTWLHWMNAHPTVADYLSFCYSTFTKQGIILFVALYALKHVERAKIYFAALLFSGILTSLLAALLPAVGAYVHYNLLPADYPNILPAVARVHEEIYLQLRAGHFMPLPWLYDVKGVITFPSFHATGAILYIYASLAFTRGKYLLIPLNLGMLASVLVDGGHYLVDALAGVLIAFAAIALMRYLART